MENSLKVELATSAAADLAALFDYVATTRSSAEAHVLLDQLVARSQRLTTYPERGPVPQELAALGVLDFRQLLHGRYRMIYRVEATKVVVVMIADGRRDMKNLLQQRLLGN